MSEEILSKNRELFKRMLKNASVRNLTPEQQRAELEAKPNRDVLEEMVLNLMRQVDNL